MSNRRRAIVAIAFSCLALTAGTANAGWYLLKPPHVQHDHGLGYETGPEFTFDSSAPLTRWEQDGAYHTAKECEAARQEERYGTPANNGVLAPAGYHRLIEWADHFECVATNDPRLREGR
jgi:hypothetical protein